MKNESLEKALKETWKNKEKFYADTKGLSMLEIVKNIESKYKEHSTAPNKPLALRRRSGSDAKKLGNNI